MNHSQPSVVEGYESIINLDVLNTFVWLNSYWQNYIVGRPDDFIFKF